MAVADGQGIAVRDLAVKVFDSVIEQWTAAVADNPDLKPLPDRQYIAPGNPSLVAWDCEQFVVGLEGIGWGMAPDTQNPSPQASAGASVMSVRHAIFNLQLVRCTPRIPEGRGAQAYPPVDEMHESGLAFMDDVGYMSQALVHLVSQLKQGLPRSALVQAGAVTTLGAEGGFHATEATLAITAGELR